MPQVWCVDSQWGWSQDHARSLQLHGHINWSLSQAQDYSWLSLSQFSTSVRGGKARSKTSFQFNVQKWHLLESAGGSFAKKPILDTKSCQGAKKSAVGASASPIDSRKKGSYKEWYSWCATVYNFITIAFICCADWYTSPISQSMEKHTFNTFVHNMVKGYHIQLRCHPLLFHNFKWFNIEM